MSSQLSTFGNPVSLVELKTLATRVLKEDSTLRSIILSQSDSIGKVQAMAKLEVFVKLLYRELRAG